MKLKRGTAGAGFEILSSFVVFSTTFKDVFSTTFKDVLLLARFEVVARIGLDVGGLGAGALNLLRLFDTELDVERTEVVLDEIGPT